MYNRQLDTSAAVSVCGKIHVGRFSKITYDIADPIPGQKVSGFLKEKGYSQQSLVNLKKDEQSILINGNYEHQNYVLQKGDRLTVQIREPESYDGILPVKLPFTIVYEDEDLFVIDKPAGMPIHPSRNNPDNSLGNALAWYMKEKGIPFVFRCINRLDRDTSGLTIVAKHMEWKQSGTAKTGDGADTSDSGAYEVSGIPTHWRFPV